MEDGDDDDGQIQPNLRPLRIVETLAAADHAVTIAEIGQELGLPKPTIHRLFQTLEREGYVERDLAGRGFVPGRRVRQLAAQVLASSPIRHERKAILRRLSETVGESCNIAVPDGDAMVYVERVETEWPLRIRLPVGTRVPLNCTASGKMFLASLPAAQLRRTLNRLPLEARTPRSIADVDALLEEVERTRQHGHSEDNEEMIEGMIAIATPILDPAGRFLGTTSFHAPVQRLSLHDGRRFLGDLRRAAEELAAMSGAA